MDLDQAIDLLKKTVKFSAVKNQKHIDLTLVSTEDRFTYEKALALAMTEVKKGAISETELKQRLGLS
jgi:hypothetical protein